MKSDAIIQIMEATGIKSWEIFGDSPKAIPVEKLSQTPPNRETKEQLEEMTNYFRTFNENKRKEEDRFQELVRMMEYLQREMGRLLGEE